MGITTHYGDLFARSDRPIWIKSVKLANIQTFPQLLAKIINFDAWQIPATTWYFLLRQQHWDRRKFKVGNGWYVKIMDQLPTTHADQRHRGKRRVESLYIFLENWEVWKKCVCCGTLVRSVSGIFSLWKTLCSLLVLWMTRTNQEDVSAFQFHLLGMNHMHKDLPEAHFGLEKSASAPFSFAW